MKLYNIYCIVYMVTRKLNFNFVQVCVLITVIEIDVAIER